MAQAVNGSNNTSGRVENLEFEIEFNESGSDDELRGKLSKFYAKRALTKQPIAPADQARHSVAFIGMRFFRSTNVSQYANGGLVPCIVVLRARQLTTSFRSVCSDC